MIGEVTIPFNQTNGDFLVQIINKEQIRKRLSKVKTEERTKIAVVTKFCPASRIISTF
ncbi:hypothetical protein LINPERPRIM_LOCUS29283 [Linum perenne]